MPRPSRRSAKEELMKRLEGDYNRKKGGGSLFRSDLRGVNFWSCKEGEHIIDIIPYTAGENDPIAPGSESYVLELFVHNNVGQQEGMIICLSETFKQPCPICEERRRLIKKGEDEARIKELTPSRYPRSIYNIVCYDNADEQSKGVQIWHTSNYLLQQYLLALAKKPIRGGQSAGVEPFIPFMDLDDGKSVAFKREGQKENTKFIGIRFEDRDYKISDVIADAAHVLDDLVAWPTYEDVYRDFWGVPFGGENVTATPETQIGERRDPPPPPEPERVRVVDPAPSGRTRRTPEPDPPSPAESTRSRRDAEPAQEESGRSRRGEEKDVPESVGNRCPAGKNFGVDIDDLKECDKCVVWKDCAKEADAIEKAKRK